MYYTCTRIPWALGTRGVHCAEGRLKERWSPWGLGTGHWKSVTHFPMIYQCDGFLFVPPPLGRSKLRAKICGPWERFPSRSCGPKVEAPGCSRLQASTCDAVGDGLDRFVLKKKNKQTNKKGLKPQLTRSESFRLFSVLIAVFASSSSSDSECIFWTCSIGQTWRWPNHQIQYEK